MDLPSFEFGTIHSKLKEYQYDNTKNATNSIETGQTAQMHNLDWLYSAVTENQTPHSDYLPWQIVITTFADVT
jgi:hypothetical protein